MALEFGGFSSFETGSYVSQAGLTFDMYRGWPWTCDPCFYLQSPRVKSVPSAMASGYSVSTGKARQGKASTLPTNLQGQLRDGFFFPPQLHFETLCLSSKGQVAYLSHLSSMRPWTEHELSMSRRPLRCLHHLSILNKLTRDSWNVFSPVLFLPHESSFSFASYPALDTESLCALTPPP